MAVLLATIEVAPGEGGELVMADTFLEARAIEVRFTPNRTSSTWTIAGDIYRLVALPGQPLELVYDEEATLLAVRPTLVEWMKDGTYTPAVVIKPWLAGGVVQIWSVDGLQPNPDLTEINDGVTNIITRVEELVTVSNLPGLSPVELVTVG